MTKIIITLKGFKIMASINTDSSKGKAIISCLPIISKINTWGDELYFPFNLNTQIESPVNAVNLGDIAYSYYWKALCIFYGKTPYSGTYEIIPNGPVK